MANFKVTVHYESNGEPSLKEIDIDALSLHASPDWMIFSSDWQGVNRKTVAAFPTNRVVSIVKEREGSSS